MECKIPLQLEYYQHHPGLHCIATLSQALPCSGSTLLNSDSNLRFSCMEIYEEKIYDLMGERKPVLK